MGCMTVIVAVSVVLTLGIILYSHGYETSALSLIPVMLFLLFWKKSCVFNPQGRAVFITGCDSGFGHELAKRLDHMGFIVFAACLFPDGEGAQSLVRKCSSQLKVIKVDVTQDEDVEQAKKIIENNLPEKGTYNIIELHCSHLK